MRPHWDASNPAVSGTRSHPPIGPSECLEGVAPDVVQRARRINYRVRLPRKRVRRDMNLDAWSIRHGAKQVGKLSSPPKLAEYVPSAWEVEGLQEAEHGYHRYLNQVGVEGVDSLRSAGFQQAAKLGMELGGRGVRGPEGACEAGHGLARASALVETEGLEATVPTGDVSTTGPNWRTCAGRCHGVMNWGSAR